MSPRTSVSEIGQIALTVSNVAEAKTFYADVLGLTPLFDAGPNLSFLAAGSVRVMLTAPEGESRAGRNSILYFRTPNVVATYESIVEHGATPEQGPRLTARMPEYELWLAFVRDPDGNLVGLMEERAPASPPSLEAGN